MSDESPEVEPEGADLEALDAKVGEFMVKVDALLVETFGPPSDDNHVRIILGLNVGTALVLSSNLPTCAVGEAIHDLHDLAMEDHAKYHAEDGDHPYMTLTDLSQVPEDVREEAVRLAEAHGIPLDQVIFRAAVDTDDLTDEGLAGLIGTPFDPTADPEPGERPVLTGDDDIAEPHETAKDIRDVESLGDLGDGSDEG